MVIYPLGEPVNNFWSLRIPVTWIPAIFICAFKICIVLVLLTEYCTTTQAGIGRGMGRRATKTQTHTQAALRPTTGHALCRHNPSGTYRVTAAVKRRDRGKRKQGSGSRERDARRI